MQLFVRSATVADPGFDPMGEAWTLLKRGGVKKIIKSVGS